MQEIGTWTTSEGSMSATLQFESEIGEDDAQELPKWASGALSGALGGAATGAAAGPWGALIGAAAGATIGGVTAATQPEPPKTALPPKAPPPATASPAKAPPTAKAAAPPPAQAGTPGTAGVAQQSAIRALQQFAAAVPALIQLVAAGTGARKEAMGSDAGSSETADEFAASESLETDEWSSYSADEGAWTIHE
jgi:hypothetical protein